jgi:serine/threonine protein kinase
MSASGAPDKARNVPVSPGDVLSGKYRLERVIGSGGVGVVFAATHLGLDQTVAIKLLQRSAFVSDENVSRFEREVRVLARISSEHVARVMDTGQLPTGEPFMVLEHLEGEDLGVVIKERGPIPIAEAVDIIVQVCEGVALAHGLGVVHRDLKPANLFLTRGPDGSPVAKVLDFGISKLRNPGSDDQTVTRTLSVLGSPLYMSPEQIETPREADERSDVWSLGVILYELVTGKAPFDATTLPLLCASICTSPPVPLTDHLPAAPEGIWRVVLRCLEKDREKRFGSVAELALALAPFGTETSRRSADRAQKIAESHGMVVRGAEEPAPESVGRRWSWSTMPPGPPRAKRSRRNRIAMALLALLGVAIVWAAYGRDSYTGQRASAGMGIVQAQARFAGEMASRDVAAAAVAAAVTTADGSPVEPHPTTVPSSSSGPRVKPPTTSRPRPKARRKGSDADVLSER